MRGAAAAWAGMGGACECAASKAAWQAGRQTGRQAGRQAPWPAGYGLGVWIGAQCTHKHYKIHGLVLTKSRWSARCSQAPEPVATWHRRTARAPL